MEYIKSYSCHKEKCNRKYMEDYFNIFFCFENNCWIFNICDGHGGFEVAEYINNNFYIKVIESINKLKEEKKEIDKNIMKDKITELVEELDNEIERLPYGEYTGSTLVAVIYYKDNLFFVNVGDSNIICNKQDPYFNILHVPSDKTEKNRIMKKSYIENDRIEGMINLSRAFGDFRFKKKNKLSSPMISTPDIHVIEMKQLFEYIEMPWILLSSDGLLLLFEREELKDIINTYLENGFSANDIVKTIIKYCSFYNNDDNTTVVLLCFKTNKNIKNGKFFDLIKKKIRQYSLEILKEDLNMKKSYFIDIRNRILKEFSNFRNLKCIYKLLEAEVLRDLFKKDNKRNSTYSRKTKT